MAETFLGGDIVSDCNLAMGNEIPNVSGQTSPLFQQLSDFDTANNDM